MLLDYKYFVIFNLGEKFLNVKRIFLKECISKYPKRSTYFDNYLNITNHKGL